MKCKICDSEFDNINRLSKHLNILHHINLLDYYVKYENFQIPKCPYCGENCKLCKELVFRKTCCSKECISKQSDSLIHTDDTKSRMSILRKNYLHDNPDKHVWKRHTKFISEPCEYLKKILDDYEIPYINELTPLKDKNYSIDIAFPNEKIGIEVNGNQHYERNGELRPYYKERKIEIEKEGWLLMDIHYSNVYKDNFIKNLISFLQKKIDVNAIDLSFKFKKEKPIKKCTNCEKELYKYNKSGLCPKCAHLLNRKVERPSYNILIEDIKKLGYRGTGKKYGVSDSAIKKWILFHNKYDI